jgi:transposase-like protein
MKRPASRYRRHRFEPEINQCAIRLHYRFNLGYRDIEDPLARQRVDFEAPSAQSGFLPQKMKRALLKK